MRSNYLTNSCSIKTKNTALLQPALAWIAILGLVGFSMLCLLVAPYVLRLAFPVAAFAVGCLLYWRYPLLYVGFSWWIWFLTPWLRRLIDFRSVWVDPSPVLLTPFLVALIPLVAFLRDLPNCHRQGKLPFILACAGIAYGFCIGIIKNSPASVAIECLTWLAPVLFSWHLYTNWQEYPSYRQCTQRVFFWCVLLTGAYGIFQYLTAPEWDALWIVNSNLRAVEAGAAPSFGQAKPLELRVFSTMNGPGVFAFVMASGLIVLLSQQNLSFLVAGVGILSLLLSLVRSGWLVWLTGMLVFMASLRSAIQIRLILMASAIAVVVLPFATMEPFAEILHSRFQSFSSNDHSFNDRMQGYQEVFVQALSNIVGDGFGARFESVIGVNDSAILKFLVALGWIGTILYLIGFFSIFFALMSCTKVRSDPFLSATRAASFGIFSQFAFGAIMLGLQGVVLWSFAGLAMAGRRYHRNQQALVLQSDRNELIHFPN